MVGDVERINSSLAAVVAALDPSAVPESSVVELLDAFDQIERLAAGAKTSLARRLEDTVEWQRSGSLTPAEFLAARSGTSVSAAKDTLTTSDRIVELPVVEAAVRGGELS